MHISSLTLNLSKIQS